MSEIDDDSVEPNGGEITFSCCSLSNSTFDLMSVFFIGSIFLKISSLIQFKSAAYVEFLRV